MRSCDYGLRHGALVLQRQNANVLLTYVCYDTNYAIVLPFLILPSFFLGFADW